MIPLHAYRLILKKTVRSFDTPDKFHVAIHLNNPLICHLIYAQHYVREALTAVICQIISLCNLQLLTQLLVISDFKMQHASTLCFDSCVAVLDCGWSNDWSKVSKFTCRALLSKTKLLYLPTLDNYACIYSSTEPVQQTTVRGVNLCRII